MIRGLLAIFALGTTVAWAGGSREEMVASVHGGAPYLLVFKDSQGNSDLEPGLYVRDDLGRWNPAFHGEVTPAPVRGGLHLQLEIGQATGRYESIALVSGRLILFGAKSNEAQLESFIAFGGENQKIFDPTTDNYVEVPLISDGRDISLFEKMIDLSGESYQVVIASLKHSSPMGKGMTFAFVLQPSKNIGEKVQLEYEPILLDWNYWSPSEIASRFLSRENGYGFDSLNLTRKLSRFREGDPTDLRLWREDLQKVLAGEITLRQFEKKDFGQSYPYLGFEDGQLEIDSNPSTSIEISGRNALMAYDVVEGRHGILLSEEATTYRDFKAARPFISGSIAFDEGGAVQIESLQSLSSQSGQLTLLHMVKQNPILLAQGFGSKKPLVALSLRPTDPTYLEDLPVEVSWITHTESKLVLVSWKFENGSVTSIYELDTIDNALKVINQTTLSKRFYEPAELERRLATHNGVLAFDDLTPKVATREEYDEQHKLTKPHIDILASLNKLSNGTRELRHYFPQPLEEISVSGRIKFRRFENISGVETRTGLYPVSENSEAEKTPLVRGELVKTDLSVLGSGILSEMTVDSPVSARGDLTALAVDPRSESGAKGVQIQLVYSPYDRSLLPQTLRVSSDDFAIGDLNAVGFIQFQGRGRKDKSEKGDRAPSYLVYTTLKDGTLKLLNFSIELKRDQVVLKKNWDRIFSQRHPLPAEEIVARLRLDGSDEVYWVKTPELDDMDTKSVLVRLNDGRDILTRQVRIRRIQDHELSANQSAATGSWRVLTLTDEDRARTERLKGASEFQVDPFPDFRDLLEDLANPQKPARHIIYIVPDELEKWAEDYPFALHLRDTDRAEHWSSTNYRLQLSRIKTGSGESTQDEVFSNFETMREASGHTRPVLLGTLKEVKQVSRPKPETSSEGHRKNFFLGVGQISSATLENIGSNPELHPPHLLYMIATEGRRVALTDFKARQSPKMIPTILIGTRKQLSELAADASFEEPFGVIQDFEIRELAPPTLDRRMAFVANILKRPEIQLLTYQYDPEGLMRPGEKKEDLPATQAQLRFVEYLVNRAEALSRSNQLGVFEGFMKVMNILGKELTENTRTRRDRKLSKSVVERILSKVFSMPLNLEQLPPSDFLRILSRRDAAFLVQQAGYHAPLDFINRAIRTIVSQLTANDIKKPNSLMIIGESGTGKTQLLKTLLFDVLRLKPYDFRATFDDNRDAVVFWVEMKKVKEGEKSATHSNTAKFEVEDSHSMAEIDAHLDRFLVTENGHRGFIVFDDIREAPPKVRSHFLARIRALQDNPSVTVRVNDRRFETNTRNLTPIVTLNPTDAAEEIERIAGKNRTPTFEDIILASLSAPDGSDNLNRSFLARWGAIINLDIAPTQAKDPKLLKTAKKTAQTILTNNRRLVLISGESVREVTSAFPTYDFRTLVAPAASTMVQLPSREGPGVYIVVPRRSVTQAEIRNSVDSTGRYGSSSETGGTDVEVYVQKRLKAIRVDGDHTGRIEFLKFLMSNFRRRAFDWLVRSASADARFAQDPMHQQLLLAPLALAVHRHLTTYPEPQLDAVVIDETSMNIKNELEKRAFRDAWKRIIDTEPLTMQKLPSLSELQTVDPRFGIDGFMEVPPQGGREKIITDRVRLLTRDLGDLLAHSLSIKDWRNPPKPEDWLKSLTPQDMRQDDPAVKALAESALSFFREMMEAEPSKEFFIPQSELNSYQVMRLFLVAFDRAIYRLAWGQVTHFLVEGLEIAVGDLSKGQSPGVQHFLFEGKSSPLSAIDLGLVLGSARYQPFFEEGESSESKHHDKFMEHCKKLVREVAP